MAVVLIDRKGAVASVTLNRPDAIARRREDIQKRVRSQSKE